MNLSRSHAEAPQLNFDRIARLYRWLEYCTFGRLLERCRFAQLARLGEAKFALILGDGDGRFLAELVRINPKLQADVVDVSEAMLTLARARVSHAAGLNFQRVDIRSFQPPPGRNYDLVVTHFFLDCLTEQDISQLADRLNLSLSSHATWIVSEFAIPARGSVRFPARLLIRILYLAFRFLTGLRVQRLPEYAPRLEQAGFLCEHVEVFLGGILRSERWCRTS
jgi:SAM-dependent methyltransferase